MNNFLTISIEEMGQYSLREWHYAHSTGQRILNAKYREMFEIILVLDTEGLCKLAIKIERVA